MAASSAVAGASARATDGHALPDGVFAELRVPSPALAWESLREPLAEVLPWRPASFNALAVAAGVPPGYAPLISGDVPLVGVIGEQDSELRWVVSVHVRSARELRAALSTGSRPTHRARQSGELTVLEPVDPSAPVLGIVGQRLLVARYAAELERWGRFVAHSRGHAGPTRSPIGALAPRRSLRGPFAGWVEREYLGWREQLTELDRRNRERHGGRAPDYADPLAALDVAGGVLLGFLDVLKSAEEARLELHAHSDHLRLLAELVPGQAGPARELERRLDTADLSCLGELPGDTALALLTRSTAAGRSATASSSAGALSSLFGGRLGGAERQNLERSLAALAEGRGPRAMYAVTLSGGQPTLVFRADAEDAAAFEIGAKGLLELARSRAIADPLRQFAGIVGVDLGTLRDPGIQRPVTRGRFLAQGPASGVHRAGFDVMWATQGPEVFGVAGREPLRMLADLMAGLEPEARLSADPASAAAFARAGKDVSLALFLRPLSVQQERGRSSAPVLVSFGRRGGALLLSVDCAWAALPAMLDMGGVGTRWHGSGEAG